MGDKTSMTLQKKGKECFYCGYNKADGKVWHDREKEWKDCCTNCAWQLYDEVDGNVEIV